MFSVNTHSVHHSNGRDEVVQDFNAFCQIYDVTRHNVHFGHVFHASRKSGVTQGKKHIVAAVAGCKKPLVSTGWAVSPHFCTNGLRECYSHFVWAPFLV